MGSRPGYPFGLEDKAPLNFMDVSFLEDLQTLHIPTNKKLEVWTQYRQREICKKNPEKSHNNLFLEEVVWF